MDPPSFAHDYVEDQPPEAEIHRPTFNQPKPVVAPSPVVQVFLCEECKRKFPSQHLLDLHLEEAHSAFFQLAVERKKPALYACLEASCSHRADSVADRTAHWKENHARPGQPEPPFFLHNRKRKQRQAKSKTSDKMED